MSATAPPAAKSKATRVVIRILRFLVLLYVCACVFVLCIQRRLLYHPEVISLEAGLALADPQGFEPWRNPAGQFIGWKDLNEANTNHTQLLIIHGNAGSAIDRIEYGIELDALEPMDVYILEYPGYGPRTGSPSQASIFQAATEAFDLLKKQGPVYLMGESLGTGAVAYLAGSQPDSIRGILLLAPYHSMTEVARSHMPYLPTRWLLWDKYPAASYLEKYHGPIAIVLAGNDRVIPNRFGQKLYDAYQGPKKLWLMPDATHDNLRPESSAWWTELLAFWNQNARPDAP